jgi:hypothetical protein
VRPRGSPRRKAEEAEGGRPRRKAGVTGGVIGGTPGGTIGGTPGGTAGGTPGGTSAAPARPSSFPNVGKARISGDKGEMPIRCATRAVYRVLARSA